MSQHVNPRDKFRVTLETEPLEDRATPAITASIIGNTLRVDGDDNPNQIVVEYTKANGLSVWGVADAFIAVPINRIEVYGQGGDDWIEFLCDWNSPKQRLQVLLVGGDGNDTIIGSLRSETLSGGEGDDLLDAGAGNDQIWGHAGNDTLIGGSGSDLLQGGAGDDWLWGDDGADFLNGGSGRDVFRGGADRDRFKDEFDPKKWVIDGYQTFDIRQGTGGTCTIMAVLAAAANSGVSFSDRITYLGNNTYQVKVYSSWLFGLWHRPRYEVVTFDGTWYDHDAQPTLERNIFGEPTGSPTGEFWTTLMQRAVLQSEGIDWRNPQAVENWGWTEAKAHSALLGNRHWRSIKADDTSLPGKLRDALRSGAILTAGTPAWGKDSSGNEIVEKNGIVSLHAYAILDVYEWGGNWRVTLYNPWGWDSYGAPLDGRDDGVIDLSWNQFVQHFELYAQTDL
jgi:hypothetical protein